jgi:M6 family metalloprotease-like protein
MPLPYLGEEIDLFNPDGTTVRARVYGNQFAAVLESIDGYTVVQNPDSGFFEYADVSADRDELVPSGVRVGAAATAPAHLAPHVRVSAAAAKGNAYAARDTGVRPRWEQRRAQRRESLHAAGTSRAAPPPAGTTGTYTGLCLLVQFPDVAGTIARQEVDDFCNKVGYSGFGNNGSVHDYFLSVSDGKLRYTNVVIAYYTAKHNRAYYTDESITQGVRARELIVEALDSLKASGFNFSPLSSDSAGHVYALNVFYAGPIVNNWAKGLWPHSWTLASPYVASATKQFSDYQITNTGSQLTLRTFCHENGHMICDFPDLYDYGNESYGVGHYCLMCYGGSDTNPTQVSAYLKNAAAWTTKLTTLAPGASFPVQSGTNDFVIHRRSGTAEYFIGENRQKSGRDASLPDAGVALWHVDELGNNSNEQMTASMHYELSLEQADNHFDLEHHANPGDAMDLFDAASSNAFGATSTPDSKWWDGIVSGLEIDAVSASNTTMTITTKGSTVMTSVVGTWNVVGVAWGSGSVQKAGPFTFNANGTWSYAFGGGRWLQVGDMVFWNFTNAAGLVYTANCQTQAMSGIMGYLNAGGMNGTFYALRTAPAPSPVSNGDAAAPAIDMGVPADNTDPLRGPVLVS